MVTCHPKQRTRRVLNVARPIETTSAVLSFSRRAVCRRFLRAYPIYPAQWLRPCVCEAWIGETGARSAKVRRLSVPHASAAARVRALPALLVWGARVSTASSRDVCPLQRRPIAAPLTGRFGDGLSCLLWPPLYALRLTRGPTTAPPSPDVCLSAGVLT